MTPKSIHLRQLARTDVDAAVDYYARESGVDAAIGFVDALQAAFDLLGRHPHSGSLRYAYELELPDLRCMALRRYPYSVFYRDHSDHIDVWRVLHAKRDIPYWMADPEAV